MTTQLSAFNLQGGLFGFSTDFPPTLDDREEVEGSRERAESANFFDKLLDALDVSPIRAPVAEQQKWAGEFSVESPEDYRPGDELNAETSAATSMWIKSHRDESRITDTSFFSRSSSSASSRAASPVPASPLSDEPKGAPPVVGEAAEGNGGGVDQGVAGEANAGNGPAPPTEE